MKKPHSITTRFIALTVMTLTLILSISSIIGLNNTINKLNTLYNKQSQLITENSRNKGTLLLDVISKISPESILGKDLYAIKSFADPICDDPDVASVEIFDKDDNTLYMAKSDDFSELASHDIEFYQREVKTDPEKMGVAINTGRVKLGFSKKSLNSITQKNKAALRKDKTYNIIFSVLQGVITNFIIAFILFIGFRKLIIKPLNGIHERVKDIAEGEGDLTLRINIEEKTEIGDLAEQINIFISNVHNLVQKIAQSSVELSESTKKIESVSKETRGNTESVSEQSLSVTENADQAAENMRNVASSTGTISSSIASVATSIEQMSATVNEIARSCQKETQIADTANIQAKSTNEKIKHLEESANKIGKVLDIITDIADQTNLLALNATIEAASAGEAGKGFAVVANEVKELAKQTSQATNEISTQIDDIRTNTHSSVDAIDKITTMVVDLNSISLTILNAVEEQSATINEISKNVSNVNRESNEMSSVVQTSAQGMNDISTKIHAVNEALKNINAAINHVEQNTVELTGITQNLQHSVDKFKI